MNGASRCGRGAATPWRSATARTRGGGGAGASILMSRRRGRRASRRRGGGFMARFNCLCPSCHEEMWLLRLPEVYQYWGIARGFSSLIDAAGYRPSGGVAVRRLILSHAILPAGVPPAPHESLSLCHSSLSARSLDERMTLSFIRARNGRPTSTRSPEPAATLAMNAPTARDSPPYSSPNFRASPPRSSPQSSRFGRTAAATSHNTIQSY